MPVIIIIIIFGLILLARILYCYQFLQRVVLVKTVFPCCNWKSAYVNLVRYFVKNNILQTFDAVDGKQARRTNSSSPLGELFDHGTFLIPLHILHIHTWLF
jgi:phosphatidylglycerophosphate synthase